MYVNDTYFHPQASCTTPLANRLCAVENNLCKCAATDSSTCGTLNQKAFVNITGASNESSSQWSCCFCSSNASYCCNKCSITTGLSRRVEIEWTNERMNSRISPSGRSGIHGRSIRNAILCSSPSLIYGVTNPLANAILPYPASWSIPRYLDFQCSLFQRIVPFWVTK